MVYKVIGLMSGSSLDGLDIAHVQLDEIAGKWSYELLHADCVPYSQSMVNDLRHAADMNVSDFLKLHTRYGKYLGTQINEFIKKYELDHHVHFIASHGHTVFHEPEHSTTCQVGDGAAIAATTGLPVISDLRAMDVALGGQGAPIVPVGDKRLFGEYDYLLNIGGIANITVPYGRQISADIEKVARVFEPTFLAFDICPANQVLNILAQAEGKEMDEDGTMAARGSIIPEVLDELNNDPYYKLAPPKSLSNEMARDIVFPKLTQSSYSNYDLLHTVTVHIAEQIANVIKQHPHGKEEATLLATGGGALNTYLIMQIEKALTAYHVTVEVPDVAVVKYKEAIVMALIGALRWREEVNVLSSVTGASKDSVGGAIWLG